MTLGQRIVSLRGERGWSQEDLAQALEVSRQSVSKWETDRSVPELDKLIKLSDLFGLTLDQLVRGEDEAPEKPQEEPDAAPDHPSSSISPGRRAAGVGMLFAGGLAALGLILTFRGFAPEFLYWAGTLLLSGSILLSGVTRPALWCAWAFWLCLDGYLRYGTGLTWQAATHTLSWTTEMNYLRLAIAWVQLAALAALLVCTLRSFRGLVLPLTKGRAVRLAAGWLALVLLEGGTGLVQRNLLIAPPEAAWLTARFLSGVWHHALTALFALLAVRTLALVRGARGR